MDRDLVAQGISRMNLTHDELIFVLGFLVERVPEDVSEALQRVLKKRTD